MRWPLLRQRRPLLEGLAAMAGMVVCEKSDGAPGVEVLPRADFRECKGCGFAYHKSWGGLCADCSGAG